MKKDKRKKRKTVNLGAAKRRLAVKREFVHALVVFLAVTIEAASILWLYRPAETVSGGITGIGMLLTYVTGGKLQSWIPILILNLPLLVLAFKKLHLKFTIYTACATVYFSVAVAVLENVPAPAIFDMTNPVMPLISIIFGAVINGAMGAWIIRQGASTGGLDIVSLLLNKKYSFPMGTISLAFNVLIVAALAFIKGPECAALSIIAQFVCTVSFNNAIMGFNRTRTLLIISDRWEEFAPEVLREVHRGVTYIPCRGAYTNAEKRLVYIVAKTTEVAAIRRLVLQHDPQALISVIDTREVVGKGFSANN